MHAQQRMMLVSSLSLSKDRRGWPRGLFQV